MVFNTTFNNISVISIIVSFIGGGNQTEYPERTTCRKSLKKSHNAVSSTPHERDLNSQLYS